MALGARARATVAGTPGLDRLGGLVPPTADADAGPLAVSGELVLLRPIIPALAAFLALAALVAGVPILYYLVYALAALVALSFLWTRSLVQSLSVTRVLRTKWCVVGEAVVEEFVLRNHSRLPGLWVEVRDESTIPGYEPGSVQALGGRDVRSWRSSQACDRRGLYTLGPLRLLTGDPFGIFQGAVTYHASTSFIVYPPLLELPALPMPYGRLPGSSRTHLRSLEVTTDAAGIRDYAPGDGLHRIHWLSSARSGDLRSKEFDFEPSGNLWVVLDLDAHVQAGQGAESTEEYSVNVAGAVIHRAIRDGKAVGLVAYGATRTIVPPGKGTTHLWRLLEVLATVRADGPDPLDRVLTEAQANLGRGLSVVVVTPSVDPAWVHHLQASTMRGLVPAAILVDAASFASDPDRVRAGLSARALSTQLGSVGILSHVVRKGQEFRQVSGHASPATIAATAARRRAS